MGVIIPLPSHCYTDDFRRRCPNIKGGDGVGPWIPKSSLAGTTPETLAAPPCRRPPSPPPLPPAAIPAPAGLPFTFPTASKLADPAPPATSGAAGCDSTREPPLLLLAWMGATTAGDGASLGCLPCRSRRRRPWARPVWVTPVRATAHSRQCRRRPRLPMRPLLARPRVAGFISRHQAPWRQAPHPRPRRRRKQPALRRGIIKWCCPSATPMSPLSSPWVLLLKPFLGRERALLFLHRRLNPVPSRATHQDVGPSTRPRQVQSSVIHVPRLTTPVDQDGFHIIQSRCRWRCRSW